MAVNEGDGVRLDIDHLVSSIQDMVPQGSLIPPTCCIFKIPVILFRHNKEAFIPDAFSIGPLHHGSPNLKATEKIKAKYLQGLISRSHSPDTMLRTMVCYIMEVEKKARECYAEAIHYNPEQLVQILVIDGCFLIEFFRKFTNKKLRKEDDPVFSRSCMLQFLFHDLILLENQVPWMVLEILFKLTVDPYNHEGPLILLAMKFFTSMYFSNRMPPKDHQDIKFEGIKHFVDLFRKLSTLSSSEEKKEGRREWELLPSATSLVKAGIKFKRGSSQCILDIKFNDGVLEIPPLLIDDVTETVFRNLISYEQCHPNYDDKITSYAMLLDNLIISVKDVNILCENKIIDNWLNPEDAAQLFNKLYNDTSVAYHYTDLCGQVNTFCKRHWPRWRAVLVRNYFNTPWAVLSNLAAIILLILTLLQTLYGMEN